MTSLFKLIVFKYSNPGFHVIVYDGVGYDLIGGDSAWSIQVRMFPMPYLIRHFIA